MTDHATTRRIARQRERRARKQADEALRAAVLAAGADEASEMKQDSPEGEKAALRAGKRGKQE